MTSKKEPLTINNFMYMKQTLLSIFCAFSLLACNQVEGQKQTSDTAEQSTKASKKEGKKRKAFDYLETFHLGGNVFIHYDKNSATILNKLCGELPENDPLYGEGPSYYDVLVMEFKISKQASDKYLLVFSSGPSNDPSFSILDAKTKKHIQSFSGTTIYIPGNKSVYVSGRENNCFNKRSKYVFKDNKFVEAVQPFYYVGLKTKTLKPIVLYSDKALTQKLAYLPANYDIEVVVAETTGNNFNMDLKYLVKTTFGLVGWVEIKGFDGGEGLQVEGIRFMGD